MSIEITEVDTKTNKAEKVKKEPIGRLSLTQVDAALLDCDKTVKSHSELVRAKLAANASIPSNILRELSQANLKRGRLVHRRIMLLVESGDSTSSELIDKLLKVKPTKTA